MAQKCEITLLLADFMLVQHHAVMAKVVELQLLNCRNNFLGVMPFVKHAKSQHKHRIVGIDTLQ